MHELRRITITFSDEGIELAVCYLHTTEPANPGTKARTTTAARMAAVGLRRALEGLDQAHALTWGGFGTNTRESTDRIMVERKKERAA